MAIRSTIQLPAGKLLLLVGIGFLLSSLMLLACPDNGGESEENTLSLCNDYIDNDSDLLVDCDDTDCEAFCGGDGDIDADADGDADGDTDGDGDGDVDGDADGDIEIVETCEGDPDCVLALNFLVCCPCSEGATRSVVSANRCILEAEGSPERPEGCGDGCFQPELCPDCPSPHGVTCRESSCLATFGGDCVVDDDCGEGELCQVIDGEARCIEDPSECRSDDDCTGVWVCRDGLLTGVRFCWHPESDCFSDVTCSYNSFCEDEDEDGIFHCVLREGECRMAMDIDCPGEEVCVDDDGDGRGICT